jgi:hypothetical protein
VRVHIRMQETARLQVEAVLDLRLYCVLFANCGADADPLHASERMGSNIGTVRVVAEIFRELFFTAVRSHHARLNRYLRKRESPNQMFGLLRVNIGKRLPGKQAPDNAPQAAADTSPNCISISSFR